MKPCRTFGTKMVDLLAKFHECSLKINRFIATYVTNPNNFPMKYPTMTSQHFQQKTR